jgi:hypothetical protein
MTPKRPPTIDIPNVDLWEFFFERKQKPFPNHQREPYHGIRNTLPNVSQQYTVTQTRIAVTRMQMCEGQRNSLAQV